MAIVVPDSPKLDRRAELHSVVAAMIEEAALSDDAVGPAALADTILGVIEIETGLDFNAPVKSPTA
jgi:hypothetical protein